MTGLLTSWAALDRLAHPYELDTGAVRDAVQWHHVSSGVMPGTSRGMPTAAWRQPNWRPGPIIPFYPIIFPSVHAKP